MEYKHYVSALWRWAWLLVVCMLLAGAVSWYATSRMPRIYSATTTLMVGEILQDSNPQAGDIATSERLALTYAQLTRREPALQATVDTLGLPLTWQALAEQVNAIALPNTQLLQITALDADPRRATEIANELARQLILQSPTPREQEQAQRQAFVNQQLQDLQSRIQDTRNQISDLDSRLAVETNARSVQDIQSQISTLQQRMSSWQSTYASLLASQNGSTNNLRVVDPATASSIPVSPNTNLNVAAAAAMGIVLAIAAVLLIEYLNDSVKSREDVHNLLGLPTLGSIEPWPHSKRKSDKRLITLSEPTSVIAEEYRSLRTNVHFAGLDSTTALFLVTSAIPGEGKTTTAGNLAVTLAQMGRKVILCDADLRRPAVHELFRVVNTHGLSTLLLYPQFELESALVDVNVPGLRVLPSGPVAPNPSELLTSMAMKGRITQMEDIADVIIFDGPALLPVTDAAILGGLAGGVILVIDSSRTRREDVLRAKAVLDRVGVRPLGVVLNRAREPRASYYRRYYGEAASGSTKSLARQSPT